MIGRIWRAETRPEDAEAYMEVFQRTGIQALVDTPGNRGVSVLRRMSGGKAEFPSLTLRDEWDSMIALAGDRLDRDSIPS